MPKFAITVEYDGEDTSRVHLNDALVTGSFPDLAESISNLIEASGADCDSISKIDVISYEEPVADLSTTNPD